MLRQCSIWAPHAVLCQGLQATMGAINDGHEVAPENEPLGGAELQFGPPKTSYAAQITKIMLSAIDTQLKLSWLFHTLELLLILFSTNSWPVRFIIRNFLYL